MNKYIYIYYQVCCFRSNLDHPIWKKKNRQINQHHNKSIKLTLQGMHCGYWRKPFRQCLHFCIASRFYETTMKSLINEIEEMKSEKCIESWKNRTGLPQVHWTPWPPPERHTPNGTQSTPPTTVIDSIIQFVLMIRIICIYIYITSASCATTRINATTFEIMLLSREG